MRGKGGRFLDGTSCLLHISFWCPPLHSRGERLSQISTCPDLYKHSARLIEKLLWVADFPVSVLPCHSPLSLLANTCPVAIHYQKMFLPACTWPSVCLRKAGKECMCVCCIYTHKHTRIYMHIHTMYVYSTYMQYIICTHTERNMYTYTESIPFSAFHLITIFFMYT